MLAALTAMGFDFTIRVSDLIVLGGGIFTLWRIAADRREAHHDVMKILGQRDVHEKRNGILGDLQTLQEHDAQVFPFVSTLQEQFQMRRRDDLKP